MTQVARLYQLQGTVTQCAMCFQVPAGAQDRGLHILRLRPRDPFSGELFPTPLSCSNLHGALCSQNAGSCTVGALRALLTVLWPRLLGVWGSPGACGQSMASLVRISSIASRRWANESLRCPFKSRFGWFQNPLPWRQVRGPRGDDEPIPRWAMEPEEWKTPAEAAAAGLRRGRSYRDAPMLSGWARHVSSTISAPVESWRCLQKIKQRGMAASPTVQLGVLRTHVKRR